MVHVTDVKKITLMEQVADDEITLMEQVADDYANKGDSARSVFQEVTYQTLIGQKYMKTRINPSSQFNNRTQLRTLQPQLHPQR